jgi:hypothetical protein
MLQNLRIRTDEVWFGQQNLGYNDFLHWDISPKSSSFKNSFILLFLLFAFLLLLPPPLQSLTPSASLSLSVSMLPSSLSPHCKSLLQRFSLTLRRSAAVRRDSEGQSEEEERLEGKKVRRRSERRKGGKGGREGNFGQKRCGEVQPEGCSESMDAVSTWLVEAEAVVGAGSTRDLN